MDVITPLEFAHQSSVFHDMRRRSPPKALYVRGAGLRGSQSELSRFTQVMSDCGARAVQWGAPHATQGRAPVSWVISCITVRSAPCRVMRASDAHGRQVAQRSSKRMHLCSPDTVSLSMNVVQLTFSTFAC